MQKLITKYKETSPGRLCSWLKGNTIGPWGEKALLLDFSDWVAGPAVIYWQKTSTSTGCLPATVLGARNWKPEGPCSGLLVVHPLEGHACFWGLIFTLFCLGTQRQAIQQTQYDAASIIKEVSTEQPERSWPWDRDGHEHHQIELAQWNRVGKLMTQADALLIWEATHHG